MDTTRSWWPTLANIPVIPRHPAVIAAGPATSGEPALFRLLPRPLAECRGGSRPLVGGPMEPGRRRGKSSHRIGSLRPFRLSPRFAADVVPLGMLGAILERCEKRPRQASFFGGRLTMRLAEDG